MEEFEMYENLYGKWVQMDDRFNSVHIWSEELALRNKGKWIPLILDTSNVPTADYFLIDYDQEYFEGSVFGESAYKSAEVIKAMTNFAKMHVSLALKEASEKAQGTLCENSFPIVVKDSILNSYPLTNIK